MARTLADMTPEESQECIGMWVDCNLGDITVPLIFQGWASSGHPMLMDTEGYKFSTLAARVTPRFDLMRAWPPDGIPVEMGTEWGLSYSTSYDNFQEREIRLTGEDEDKIRWNLDHLRGLEIIRDSVRDVQLHRRHVTEWEATDE